MGTTKIEYCDVTWDLTIGCRKRSPGCENCWATRTVHRLAGRLSLYPDYGGQVDSDGRDWLETEDVNLLEWNLEKPRQWRKPRFVFVNSKSDLFDQRVPWDFIGRAFDVMALANWHHYMVLTKEADRMGRFLEWYRKSAPRPADWPKNFAHVILMTSVEGPDWMGRIEQLMRLPAALRGVSFEPLLGPLGDIVDPRFHSNGNCFYYPEYCAFNWGGLDWVIIGCEKLAGGRVGRWAGRDVEGWWQEARRIVERCRAAGIPVWMKQGPSLDHRPEEQPRVVTGVDDFPPSCRVQDPPNWPR
jgi:protein gp37